MEWTLIRDKGALLLTHTCFFFFFISINQTQRQILTNSSEQTFTILLNNIAKAGKSDVGATTVEIWLQKFEKMALEFTVHPNK